MTDLATVDDVEQLLRRSLTDSELAGIGAALISASASVRSYTGQQFTAGEDTTRLRVRRRVVRLPQRPVLAVTAVADLNSNEVSFTWDGFDKIVVPANVPDIWSFEPWSTGLTAVDVTYSYGYGLIPDDIIAVVAAKAARSVVTTPENAGVTQMALGDTSIGMGSIAAAGALGFFQEEREILDRYRRTLGVLRVD
jgi:hypothetical protein